MKKLFLLLLAAFFIFCFSTPTISQQFPPKNFQLKATTFSEISEVLNEDVFPKTQEYLNDVMPADHDPKAIAYEIQNFIAKELFSAGLPLAKAPAISIFKVFKIRPTGAKELIAYKVTAVMFFYNKKETKAPKYYLLFGFGRDFIIKVQDKKYGV